MEKYFSFEVFIQFLIKVTKSWAQLLELLFIELEMNFFKHHKKIIVGGNFSHWKLHQRTMRRWASNSPPLASGFWTIEFVCKQSSGPFVLMLFSNGNRTNLKGIIILLKKSFFRNDSQKTFSASDLFCEARSEALHSSARANINYQLLTVESLFKIGWEKINFAKA